MRWVTNSCPLPSCIFSIGRNKVKCVDWNEYTYTRGVANLKPSRPGPIIFFSAYFTSQIWPLQKCGNKNWTFLRNRPTASHIVGPVYCTFCSVFYFHKIDFILRSMLFFQLSITMYCMINNSTSKTPKEPLFGLKFYTLRNGGYYQYLYPFTFLKFFSEIVINMSDSSYFFPKLSPDYGVDYFKQFDVVMNALDNRGRVIQPFHSKIWKTILLHVKLFNAIFFWLLLRILS